MGLPEAPVEVDRIEVAVYRAPIERPVRTAFGTMVERPAVIVRAIADGIVGFGEVWCNFPTCGAEHRARLVECFFVPLVRGRVWRSPRAAFEHLTAQARILALQAGEPGPIAQAIAGIDVALWDLVARRERMPLWRLLGGRGAARIPAYASGINPDGALEQAKAARDDGFSAFKLKIGFSAERDLDNLAGLREGLGADATIALDANQAWGLDEAVEMSRALAPFAPLWLEEPIAADSPPDDWRRLADASPVPLAAGENLRGDQAFDALVEARAVKVIQPDLAKWGGISGCLPLARRIRAAGLRYCPHYLGGGIGLVASAHLLAAAGGDGLLEIDCNPNTLRAGLAMPLPELRDGAILLGEAPGLGVEPDPAIERYRRHLAA
jgi:D-galactarolactone cycloisomerase